MELDRALEGIENKEVIKRLENRKADILDADDEKSFWEFRAKLLKKDAIADPLSSPLEPIIPILPFPLALVVSEYINEKNEYIKLHRLCDASEMFTRFAVVVSLVNLHQSSSGFSAAMKNVLMSSIKRPSFGSWLGMLRQALKDGGKSPLMKSIRDYVTNHLEPILQGTSKAATIEQAILPMRNHLAHAGRLPDSESKSLLASHQRRFEQEVVLAANFWLDYNLVIGGADELLLAQGLPEDNGEFTAYQGNLQVEQGHAVLLYKDEVLLDLYPMHAFLEVIQARDEQDEKLGAMAPQLYCRMGDEPVVEFTVLHDEYSFSQQRAHILEAWQQMLPVDEWQQSHKASKGKKLWEQRFANLQTNLSDIFVGRKDEMDTLKKLVKVQEHSVLWVTGKAGMGKSAVMARMVAVTNNWDDYITIPYYFRAGHSYCSTNDFLKACLDYFGAILCKRIALPDPSAINMVFLESLKEVSQGSNRLIFILDGLDEIERIKPGEILDILEMAKSVEGVTWLCAGRPEEHIVQSMRQLNAEFVFGEDGLDKLNPDAIRAILDYDLGPKKYDLYENDKLKDGVYGNQWLDTIEKRSEGLPIYVRLLTKDIARGNRKLEDVDKLPAGLAAYYEDTLARLKVSSVGAALTTIFCLLAQAREPLDEALLYLFLSDFKSNLRQENEAAWTAGIQRALNQGSMMMVRESTPEGKPGWQLYHESFNDLLMASPSVKEDRQEAMLCIRKQCAHWSDNKVIQSYSLRHFFYHLRQANKSEDIFALMRDDHFIDMQQQQDIELPMSALLETLQVAHSDKNWICMAEFSLQRGKLIDALRHESPWDAIRRGTLQRALDLADLYDVKGRSESLLLCAWELLGQSKGEQAKEVLQHLFEKEKYTLGGILLSAEIILANFILVCGVDSLYLNHWGDAVLEKTVSSLLTLEKNNLSMKVCNQALEIAQSIDDSEKRLSALINLASALVALDPKQARQVYKQALEVAQSIDDSHLQSLALSNLASALVALDPKQARQVYKQALEVAQSIDDSALRSSALGSFAFKLVKLDFGQALEVAYSIDNSIVRPFTLGRIASELVKLDLKQALKVAHSIDDSIHRSFALQNIASVLAEIDPEEALKMAHSIDNSMHRTFALNNIASTLEEIDPEQAKYMHKRALGIASSIVDSRKRSSALNNIASTLAGNDPEQAKQIYKQVIEGAHSIDNPMKLPLVLNDIASLLTRSDPEQAKQFHKRALGVASSIVDSRKRSSVLSRIASSLEVVDPEQSRQVYKQALEAAYSIDSPMQRSSALSDIASALEVVDPEQSRQVYKQALEAAHSIGSDNVKNIMQRSLALSNIASALAGIDPGQALEVAYSLHALGQRSSTLGEIASVLAKIDSEKAKQVYKQALEIAHSIDNSRERSLALSNVASTLAGIDPEKAKQVYKQALEIAHSIGDSMQQACALNQIVPLLAEINPRQALEVAHSINSPLGRSREILSALVKLDPEQALEVARSIDASKSRVQSSALSHLVSSINSSYLIENNSFVSTLATSAMELDQQSERLDVLFSLDIGKAVFGGSVDLLDIYTLNFSLSLHLVHSLLKHCPDHEQQSLMGNKVLMAI